MLEKLNIEEFDKMQDVDQYKIFLKHLVQNHDHWHWCLVSKCNMRMNKTNNRS